MSLKSGLLSLFLLLVVISSMNIEGVSDKMNIVTDIMGISVPMTPLTADMAQFSKDSNSIYKNKFDLIVTTKTGDIIVDQKKLDFHINKLPLETSFSNQIDENYEVELNRYVCKQLNSFMGMEVLSFRNSLTNKKENCDK